MAKIITQLDMFRNTGIPLQGVKAWPWAYAGNFLTAQAAVFHGESIDGLDVHRAFWRITWKPNITGANQTSVRIVSADDGPTNIEEVVATFSGGKPNSPLNEAFDITAKTQALIDCHSGTGKGFQFIQQSEGDGTYGCLIYSSSIELVLNT